MRHQLF